MSDPILEEIWRVREELIKRHGGLDGYLDYIEKLDRTRRKRDPKSKGKVVRKQNMKNASVKAAPKTTK
jgi:hypothetical protein